MKNKCPECETKFTEAKGGMKYCPTCWELIKIKKDGMHSFKRKGRENPKLLTHKERGYILDKIIEDDISERDDKLVNSIISKLSCSQDFH